MAGLINKVDLLYKATTSRLEEKAILSSVQKPTQRVKENEETEEYVPNKRT